MEHYICRGGCEGVSEKPGTCNAEGCPNYQKPLEKCACEDQKHGDTPKESEEKKE